MQTENNLNDLILYDTGKTFTTIFGNPRFSFPEGVIRVSAGAGGESILVWGDEKTALLDCGMAYSAKGLIHNIRVVLSQLSEQTGRACTLDYILATHTHYDHIGGLSAVRLAWPEACVCAGAYAANVFSRPGAFALMKKMSLAAAKLYAGMDMLEMDFDAMQVDRIVREGDRIDLGGRSFLVFETPGHTNCSVSYALEPDRLFFINESMGCLIGDHQVISNVLKSYADAFASIEKCRAYDADALVVPHSGVVDQAHIEEYWNILLEEMNEKIAFVKSRQDLPEEEILEAFMSYYWEHSRGDDVEQPYEAFAENAVHEVRAALEY